MIPVISKPLDDVAIELRGWLDGESNPKLDEWYRKYGHRFIDTKRKGA